MTSDRYANLGQWSTLHAFALGAGKLAFSLSQETEDQGQRGPENVAGRYRRFSRAKM